MRFGQLVMGPAGSGKSTYCSTILKHCEDIHRRVNVVNLDPAAEHFDYQPIADIRDLIHLDDAMEDEDLQYGPNGGLIFCLEHLVQNLDWFEERLGEDVDDYILFDCPGQIELFTHLDIMQRLVQHLQHMEFNICGVYMIDSKFMVDTSVFVSGALSALSAMVSLEIPHINVLSKVDLLSKHARAHIESFLETNTNMLLEDENVSTVTMKWNSRYAKLNKAIATVLDDYSMVKFIPLNRNDAESISDLLLTIDNAIQYGEDLDVKIRYPEENDNDMD